MQLVRTVISLVFVACFFASTILAAIADQIVDSKYTLGNTQIRQIHSNKVGIDYLIYVSLPRDYDKQTAAYPVLYLLDANYNFPLYQSIATFLADENELPPLVLIGIGYPGVEDEKHGPKFKLNRTRDYTPTHVEKGGYGPEFDKASGGADRFLDFIEQELNPYIESNFRVKHDDRAIAGNSYGGLCASYALLRRPGLFHRYIIVSPSLWFDKRIMFSLEEKFLQSHSDLPARAFFCVGGDETASHGFSEMVGDLKLFTSKLQAKKYPKFQSLLWIAPNEGHHSVFAAAATRGLRWLYGK